MVEKIISKLSFIKLIIMGFKTTLSKASTKTNSLRTTVPSGVISQFNLEVGDKLDWKLEAGKGELKIIIKPEK